jgi:hypothetical protein
MEESGVQMAQSDRLRRKGGPGSLRDNRNDMQDAELAAECVIFVSLRHRKGEDGVSRRLEKIVIPHNLATTNRSERQTKDNQVEKNNGRAGRTMIDYDDKLFAKQLNTAYRSLSGSWFYRTLSPRKLQHIRLVPMHRSTGASIGDGNKTLASTEGLLIVKPCSRSSRA